ncbi:MAG TPA: pyridoxamine 5'-phosphate oxidase family protein [Candidatus Babeliales bacterium]|nr:pyridoxamine 5'-phosphate oxidase family protein [Candidatus Babeliales bacterium]
MNDVLRILASAEFCNIATACEDGSPWNTPVFFVTDNDQNLYWWSSLKAVHSKNILRDGRVYITILDPKATQKDALAVYIQGRATVLEDSLKIIDAMELYNKRSVFVKLTDDISSGYAPTRLFEAKADNIWLNAEGKVGDYYVDVRKRVP